MMEKIGDKIMKILGISGSPRKEGVSGVDKLVKIVLDSTGCDHEYVSLRGKTISGCISCLGCAKDNICKVKDDMTDLREKIVSADAYVIGAPNYYSTLNALTHAFMERWFQFRHQEADTLWGKLAVAVGVGGKTGTFPVNELEKFFLYNFIETVAKVTGQGAAACYSCGYGEDCKVGAHHALHGPGVKITPEITPDVSKQPDALRAAAEAGKSLGGRLKDHDRQAATERMQKRMGEKLAEMMEHSA